MSFAQVVDTSATRPFLSSPPTNIGKVKGRRRQTKLAEIAKPSVERADTYRNFYLW